MNQTVIEKTRHITYSTEATNDDEVHIVKIMSPFADYYLVYPEIQYKNNVCHEQREKCVATVHSQHNCEVLFSIDCDRYRSTGKPVFFTHNKQTYIISYPKYGYYQIQDMSGKVLSVMDDTHLFMISLKQISNDRLLLKSWMWHPMYFKHEIDIPKSLETGKFSVKGGVVDDDYYYNGDESDIE
jgi:hypothetical protein